MEQVFQIYQLECPGCGESIVLPRQSPLGKYAGLEYQRQGIWPPIFLCRQTERLYEVSSLIHSIEVTRLPLKSDLSLWEIDCECAYNHCGKMNLIFAKYSTTVNPGAIVDVLCRATSDLLPKIACVSKLHDLILRKEAISPRTLDF